VIIKENIITKIFSFQYFFNQKNSRWQSVLIVPKSFEDERCYQCLRFLKVFNIVGFSLTARMLFDVRSCPFSFFISSSFARKNSVLAPRYLIKNQLDSAFFKEWSKEISLQRRIHKQIPKPGADVKIFVLFRMLYVLFLTVLPAYIAQNFR